MTIKERIKPVLLTFHNFRIVKCDARNLQIQEFRTFKNADGTTSEKWDTNAESYFPSMRVALSALVKKKLSGEHIKSLKDVIESIDRLNSLIDKLGVDNPGGKI